MNPYILHDLQRPFTFATASYNNLMGVEKSGFFLTAQDREVTAEHRGVACCRVGKALTRKKYSKAQGGCLLPWANPEQERVVQQI